MIMEAEREIAAPASREIAMKQVDMIRVADPALQTADLAMSPILAAMFILMVGFPFVVRFLPSGLQQYLDALFK